MRKIVTLLSADMSWDQVPDNPNGLFFLAARLHFEGGLTGTVILMHPEEVDGLAGTLILEKIYPRGQKFELNISTLPKYFLVNSEDTDFVDPIHGRLVDLLRVLTAEEIAEIAKATKTTTELETAINAAIEAKRQQRVVGASVEDIAAQSRKVRKNLETNAAELKAQLEAQEAKLSAARPKVVTGIDSGEVFWNQRSDGLGCLLRFKHSTSFTAVTFATEKDFMGKLKLLMYSCLFPTGKTTPIDITLLPQWFVIEIFNTKPKHPLYGWCAKLMRHLTDEETAEILVNETVDIDKLRSLNERLNH